MALRIMDDTMTLEADNRVVATARLSEHAAADGNDAWMVSAHPARLFTRDQTIEALTVAELGKSGYPDSHPLVIAFRDGCGSGSASRDGAFYEGETTGRPLVLLLGTAYGPPDARHTHPGRRQRVRHEPRLVLTPSPQPGQDITRYGWQR